MLHGPNSPNEAPPHKPRNKVHLYKKQSKLNMLKAAKGTKGRPFRHVNPNTNFHATKGRRRVCGLRSGVGIIHTMVNDNVPVMKATAA